MQRIFTENIMTAQGKVKYPEGMVRDFPHTTWQVIEQVVGKSLDDFSDVPPESFHAQFIEPSEPKRKKLIRKETG